MKVKYMTLNQNAFLYSGIKYAIVFPCKTVKELEKLEARIGSKMGIEKKK